MKSRILSSIAASGGIAVGAYLMRMRKEKKIYDMRERINVLSDHFQLLNHWLELKNEGKSIVSYFERESYKHIAIYGMAELANRLSEELAGTPVVIDYGIDRDISCSIAWISDIYSPEDKLPETEAIIVTPYSSFDSIKEILVKKVKCPVISLEEVIWSV